MKKGRVNKMDKQKETTVKDVTVKGSALSVDEDGELVIKMEHVDSIVVTSAYDTETYKLIATYTRKPNNMFEQRFSLDTNQFKVCSVCGRFVNEDCCKKPEIFTEDEMTDHLKVFFEAMDDEECSEVKISINGTNLEFEE